MRFFIEFVHSRNFLYNVCYSTSVFKKMFVFVAEFLKTGFFAQFMSAFNPNVVSIQSVQQLFRSNIIVTNSCLVVYEFLQNFIFTVKSSLLRMHARDNLRRRLTKIFISKAMCICQWRGDVENCVIYAVVLKLI